FFHRSIFPGPTRATQHPWRNGIFPGRNCLRPQPAFNRTGPPFFYAPRWKAATMERDRIAAASAKAKIYYDAHAHALAPLKIGTEVRIQDEKTKLWEKVGVIVAIGKFRSYRVKFASGSVLWRNRRFLRPIRAAVAPDPEGSPNTPPRDEEANGTAPHPATNRSSSDSPPRRSHRERRAPNRLDL
ncbi:Uncharacterized protein APZ42_008964, partial [Daphnia magna]